jgi:putative SOS response-associated peptidase YedK
MSPNIILEMELLELLTPYIYSEMQAFPVTPEMNKPAFNRPACIKPLEQ